ncbi:cell wall-associated NlpC family hydrolase [Sphingomonas jejuensis]|uniref:Cell wall-associated NlpC family hydrolase n=1 Tax=Sphingomonas jejuensis TaxID=904715 RepID=A0ABX0XHX9_9SPHN|nr:peptidoglycan endopeptidase [Sphingomonas jejuensis]NJC32830.1 cell wall-associated NlpC family hydrolase [Sphingomonas jejuensis]
MTGETAVARARGVVGTPFRLHGRGREGIDCVGLVAVAWAVERVPTGYPLRGGTLAAVSASLSTIGAKAVAEARAGDIVAARPGPAQLHLVVLTEGGFIHADAGLRRVVEVPGAVPWPVAGMWRKEVS